MKNKKQARTRDWNKAGKINEQTETKRRLNTITSRKKNCAIA
jgi:hypothetical protein